MKALITGSSHGFGCILAATFANDGYDVWIHGRDANALKEAQTSIQDEYAVDCCVLGCDLLESQSVPLILHQIKDHKIDVVINNAAIMYGTPNDIIQTNLVVPANIMKGCFGLGLSIVNINSMAGLNGNYKEDFYCASKFGLRGFSESVKFEYAKRGTEIIDVYLGAMDVGMSVTRDDHDALIDPIEAAAAILNVVQSSTFIPELRLYRR